jgi:nicotinamidase/pyrazinamidase
LQTVWPDHCTAGTRGAELHDALRAPEQDRHVTLVLRKGTRQEVDAYGAFRENDDRAGRRLSTGLGAWLHARGVGRVFVVGLARDFCVAWTAQDALAEGLRAVVVDPLTRPVFPDRREATDHALRQAGVEIVDAI